MEKVLENQKYIQAKYEKLTGDNQVKTTPVLSRYCPIINIIWPKDTYIACESNNKDANFIISNPNNERGTITHMTSKSQ